MLGESLNKMRIKQTHNYITVLKPEHPKTKPVCVFEGTKKLTRKEAVAKLVSMSCKLPHSPILSRNGTHTSWKINSSFLNSFCQALGISSLRMCLWIFPTSCNLAPPLHVPTFYNTFFVIIFTNFIFIVHMNSFSKNERDWISQLVHSKLNV